jgi:two-component system, OmpR family, response regulator MprA
VKVLVVEDDPSVCSSLERSLTFEGYSVVTARDGETGLASAFGHRPDVIVLDLGLPGLSGLEVCRRLRAAGNDVPVLMLTARNSTSDRVSGLDAGADDYLPKPFALEELLARLRSVLRRAKAGQDATQLLVVDDLVLDPSAREVTRAGQDIPLTRTEYELLGLLMAHPRQVLSRNQILTEVWGFEFDPASNTLEVYIGYLRRKLEAGGRPRLVHTVRGVGYVIRPARSAPGA